MKVFCLTDIHANTTNLKKIIDSFSGGIDLLVVCGDWTTFGTADQVRSLLFILRQTSLPILSVAGNCDSAEIQETLEEEHISLDGAGKKIGNIGFFGLSASNATPLFAPSERSEEELTTLLECGYGQIRSAFKKVLISHLPPYNTAADKVKATGAHSGSKVVRSFIEKNPVDLVLCGHIHEAIGTDHIGSTLIANIGPAAAGYYGIATIGETIEVDLRQTR